MHHRLTRIAALVLVTGAAAAPAASARVRGTGPAEPRQPHRGRRAQPGQDLRMPDTVDAAAGRGTFSAPDVVVVKVKDPEPQSAGGGLDWGDAGIGAGGIAGLTLVSLGGALLVVQRRHARGASHA